MARLNKTIRNNILSAIIADSKFAEVEGDLNSVIRKFVGDFIIETYNDAESLKHYANLEAFKEALPEHLKYSGISLFVFEKKGNSRNCVSVYYKQPDAKWNSSLSFWTDELPEGTWVPSMLHFPKYFPKANDKLVELMEKHKELHKDKSNFASKVMGLLMSVNTTNQLEKQLPQFAKYLPADIEKATPKKTDVKEILACLK